MTEERTRREIDEEERRKTKKGYGVGSGERESACGVGSCRRERGYKVIKIWGRR